MTSPTEDDQAVADLIERLADVSDSASERIAALKERAGDDSEELLRIIESALVGDSGLAEVDRQVVRYRKQVIQRSRETARQGGSTSYTEEHVRHAVQSLRYSGGGNGGLHALLGLGGTFFGTGVGVLATVLATDVVVEPIVNYIALGGGLGGSAMMSAAGALLFFKRRFQ